MVHGYGLGDVRTFVTAFIFDALTLSFVRVTRQFYSKFTTIPQDIFKQFIQHKIERLGNMA